MPAPSARGSKASAAEVKPSRRDRGHGRTEQVLVRLSPTELQVVRQLAQAEGLTAGSFVRGQLQRAISRASLTQAGLTNSQDWLETVQAQISRLDGLTREVLLHVVTASLCSTQLWRLATGDKTPGAGQLPDRVLAQISDAVSRSEQAAERGRDRHGR